MRAFEQAIVAWVHQATGVVCPPDLRRSVSPHAGLCLRVPGPRTVHSIGLGGRNQEPCNDCGLLCTCNPLIRARTYMSTPVGKTSGSSCSHPLRGLGVENSLWSMIKPVVLAQFTAICDHGDIVFVRLPLCVVLQPSCLPCAHIMFGTHVALCKSCSWHILMACVCFTIYKKERDRGMTQCPMCTVIGHCGSTCSSNRPPNPLSKAIIRLTAHTHNHHLMWPFGRPL